jgi:hypothetical protein
MQNITKGIIYRWVVEGKTVYIGRTIQSLQSRTNSHRMEYLKQKNTNLITRKFVEVSKLANEWDEVKVELIEEVNDIGILGDRELYWFDFYSQSLELWNSVVPGSSEFLILTSEELEKKRSDKAFFKFYANFLNNKATTIVNDLRLALYEKTIIPVSNKTFKLKNLFDVIDVNEMLILNLMLVENEPYFFDLISTFIAKQERLLISIGLLLNLPNVIQIDFESLQHLLKFRNKTSIDELKKYFILNENWSYISVFDKEKLERELDTILERFVTDYSRKVDILKYIPFVLSHKKLLNVRMDDLRALYLDYIDKYPYFESKLSSFLRGSTLRIQGNNVSTQYFRQKVGIEYINVLIDHSVSNRQVNNLVKGYDVDKIKTMDFINNGDILLTVLERGEVTNTSIIVEFMENSFESNTRVSLGTNKINKG